MLWCQSREIVLCFDRRQVGFRHVSIQYFPWVAAIAPWYRLQPLVRIPSTPSTCFHQYARWNKAIWLVVVNHLTSLNELESFISAKHCNNMLTLVYDICFWWEVQIPKRIKTSYKLVTLVVLVKGSACGHCGLTIPIRITIKSENLNCVLQLHQKGK